MLLACFALFGASCCVFALFWDMMENTELGRLIIMKIKNKYNNGDR